MKCLTTRTSCLRELHRSEETETHRYHPAHVQYNMTNSMNVATFKEFARLEDPYENARYTAKLDILQPFKKQIYVGRIDRTNADIPVDQKPSTGIFMAQATAPYEIFKTDTAVGGPVEESLDSYGLRHLAEPPKVEQSDLRARSVLDRHGKWEAYIHQYSRDKMVASNTSNLLVPKCLSWTVEETIMWLRNIGMEKYEETFLANELDGARLCGLDKNRLVKMGVHSWDNLKTFSKELKVLTNRPPRPWFYSRDTGIRPMDDIDLYFEFKNVHGDHSETTSFAQFTEQNEATFWSYPEKTLRYPGMIYQNNHINRISTRKHF